MKHKKQILIIFMIIVSVAVQGLSDDYVSGYKLDNTTDQTGNYDLTNSGSTTFTTGKIGNASNHVAASSQWLYVNSDLGITNLSFSASVWVYLDPKAFTAPLSIFEKGDTGTQVDYRLFYTNTSGVYGIKYGRNKEGVAEQSFVYNITLNYSQWYHIGMVYNHTAARIEAYLNGINVGNNSAITGIGSSGETERFEVGAHNGLFYWNGRIDALYIFNRVLNSSDMTTLYNSGDGCENSFNSNCVPPPVSFQLTAANVLNNTAITTFNATIKFNGTTLLYLTTNGTIVTNMTQNTGLFNVTVNATNFFNITYLNINNSVNLQANLTPFTLIRAFSRTDNSLISNYSLNVTNSSGTFTLSTTNGVIWLPIYNQNWSLSLFNAFNGTMNFSRANVTLNGTPYVSWYNFSLYVSNVFNITFRSEQNGSILYTLPVFGNSDIIVEFLGDEFSYNYTANGTLYVELMIPQDYVIRYRKDGYGRLRSYLVTLSNQSFNQLTLYLLNDTVSSDLTITVYDSTTLNPIEGAVVYLQRFNISLNSYTTVAMYETDVAGNAYFDVEQQDELYKFMIDRPWQTLRFTSEPLYIETSSLNLYIDENAGFAENFFFTSNMSGVVLYSNSSGTPTFSISYNDPNAKGSEYCLAIKQWNQYTQRTLNLTCSSSASGSLSVTGLASGNNYAVFTSVINGRNSTVTVAWKELLTSNLNSGAFGLFLTLGIFLTAIFISFIHSYAIVLGGIALVFAKIMGILPIDWSVIVAVIITGIIILLMLDKR